MPFPRQLIASGVLGGGPAYDPTYANILIHEYGANEVWPLVDIASGTNIPAKVTSARDGTLTGWDLQNAAGPVTGTLAPYADGVNDYALVTPPGGLASLNTIFSGAVGSVFAWAKVLNAGIWTDSTKRDILYIKADANNFIVLRKYEGATGFIYVYFTAGGTQQTWLSALSTLSWFSVGLSWNKPADEGKVFINGSQVVTTKTIGTWAVPGTLIQCTFMDGTPTVPTNTWNGWAAYYAFKFGSVWSPADFAAMHAAAATSLPDV